MSSGYYCLIQVCPDPARAEAVNVGVLLYRPEPLVCLVRMSSDLGAARALVAGAGLDLRAVKVAADRMATRIETAGFSSIDELAHFARSRGNVVQVTAPRSVRTENPERDIQTLFDDLVRSGPPRPASQTHEVLLPYLETKFIALHERAPERVALHPSFEVPELSTAIDADYSYRNGHLNLVVLKTIPHKSSVIDRRAFEVNSQGQVVRKYIEDGSATLTVVGVSVEPSPDPEAEERFGRILRALGGAEFVRSSEVEKFAQRVQQDVIG
jgi:hypothetical protein